MSLADNRKVGGRGSFLSAAGFRSVSERPGRQVTWILGLVLPRPAEGPWAGPLLCLFHGEALVWGYDDELVSPGLGAGALCLCLSGPG